MTAKEFAQKLRHRKEAKQTQSGFWIHENKLPEILDEYHEYKAENLPISNVTPRFCFVCGAKLEEVGFGWLQCKSEKCGEVFLPFKDPEGNQNLMLQNTPFTPTDKL